MKERNRHSDREPPQEEQSNVLQIPAVALVDSRVNCTEAAIYRRVFLSKFLIEEQEEADDNRVDYNEREHQV